MSISIHRTQRLIDAFRAWSLLEPMTCYYPDLADWYWNKVVPGFVTGNGMLLIAEQTAGPGNAVAGVALGRKAGDGHDETKLQCLRVAPEDQRHGLGVRLFERAFEELDSDRPFISVSEEMFHDYARLLVNRFGFVLTRVEKSLYRPGKLEYQFNGDHDLRKKTPYGLAA